MLFNIDGAISYSLVKFESYFGAVLNVVFAFSIAFGTVCEIGVIFTSSKNIMLLR